MTSRVQKGGPVFRPVAKTRSRQPTGEGVRQASVPAETPAIASNQQNATIVSDASSMPPPATVPVRQPEPTAEQIARQASLEPLPTPQQEHPHRLGSVPPTLMTTTTRHESPRPPTLISSTSQTAIPSLASASTSSQQVRQTHAPPIVINQPGPTPIAVGGISSRSPSVPRVAPRPSTNSESQRPPPLQTGAPSSTLPPFAIPSLAPPNILHRSAASNVPPIIAPASSENIFKPPAISPADVPSSIVPNAPADNAITRTQRIDAAERPAKRRKSSWDTFPASETGAEAGLSVAKARPKRKRRVSSGEAEVADGYGSDTQGKKHKKRATSATPRPRKPSIPPYDPYADPGEEIDPTIVTMAALCSDTGQGRVSSRAAEVVSNHAAWKAQNREKRARMRVVMERKKYGREEDGDEVEENVPSTSAPRSAAGTPAPSGLRAPSAGGAPAAAALLDDHGEFDYTQDLETSRFNVQVRIGPNGETVIDEESLVVDREVAEPAENYTHVVESDYTKFVNSGTYGKRYRGSRWTAEETEMFYDALMQYGENYELIAYVLPGRDRKSCKNKFKAEDKRNHARINYCLSHKIPVDMNTLSRMTGKDFSGPVPEIRAPPPRSVAHSGDTAAAPRNGETPSASKPEPQRKRPARKKSTDDGALVIGDVGDFQP